MRRRLFARPSRFVGLITLAILLVAIPARSAPTYTVDQAAGKKLTAYLRTHRLPLVGASVSRAADGATQVMLYGYVATESGKRNAAEKVKRYLHNDVNLTVINRITVNPEIRKLGRNENGEQGAPAEASPSGSYSPAPASSSGSETWEQIYQEIQRAGVHPAPDPGGPPSNAW